MAGVKYDAFAGLGRLADAAARIDLGVAEVLIYHLAVEQELSIIVDKLAVNPAALRGVGHANRIKILSAFWRGPTEANKVLTLVLERFNQLRNGVAHGDEPAAIEQSKSRLRAAYSELVPGEDQANLSVPVMAAGIIGFMADAPAQSPLSLNRLVEDAFKDLTIKQSLQE